MKSVHHFNEKGKCSYLLHNNVLIHKIPLPHLKGRECELTYVITSKYWKKIHLQVIVLFLLHHRITE